MQAAIPRLEARIAELKNLDVSTLNGGSDPAVRGLSARIESTLSQIYGPNTHEYGRLSAAAHLDHTAYSMIFSVGDESSSGPSVGEIRAGVDEGRNAAIAILQAEVDSLKEAVQHTGPARGGYLGAPEQPARAIARSEEILIVHGQDGPAKIETARLIERAGLKAVILHEQANGGRTIIEKLEEHGGTAGYAVVLMTPDDVGGPEGGDMKPRARQNVIGELFWFAGKMGRSRVAALRKGDVEIPSDLHGIVYIPMDDHGGWKAALLRELGKAGYTVDWAKALA